MQPSTLRSFITLSKASWEAVKPTKFRFYTFVVLFVLANSVDLLVPWAIGYTLGVFVKEGFTDAAFEKGLYGIGAYVVLRMLHTFFHHVARYLQITTAYSARMLAMANIFEAMLSFPLRWHVHRHSGENLSKLHRSVGAIDNMIGVYVWQIIEGGVKVVFATLAIFALDKLVALNVLAMGLITILIMILFNAKLTGNIRRNNTFYDKVNRTCVDYLFNIVTVKMLRLEDPAVKYFRAHRNEGLEISKTISRYGELKWGTVGTGYGIVLGSSLLIYFYGHRGFEGAFDVAQVYVLMNYLDKIFQAIGSFTGYYGGIIEASTAYEDAASILREAARAGQASPPAPLEPGWKTISVRNLEFSYVPGEQTGLHGVQLDLNRGDKIALVGPSGGGKSTLLKILAGILTPESCRIATDRQPELTLDSLSNRALLLPQEPEIFSESVFYNLTMGQKFSPEELHFFNSLCKVENILAKLPQGWDSNLAERGLNLSVGEKQRIAMARGLLRAAGKDLLLLDEPTSSLDPMSEKEIFYGLLYHFADRTIITACHRLALVPLFDKIIYLGHGRIEEIGTFGELLAKNGSFATAWKDYERKIAKDTQVQPAL